MTDLGTLGGASSAAQAINTAGQVVGQSTYIAGVSGLGPDLVNDHAFLWQNGTMIDLNSLLPAGSGWILEDAVAINDKGQIVCSGVSGGAALVETDFLVTLPSSLAAAAVSIVGTSSASNHVVA
jgi:probable HAF family extracellular repeat protein